MVDKHAPALSVLAMGATNDHDPSLPVAQWQPGD
jgi:hypothetical protein